MLSKSGQILSITNRILAMKFASEFILIYPLMTIMFGSRGHVNATGIGVILAIGMALAVLFEIPTGVIADKVPRKYVLVTSVLFKILGFTMWLIAPSFKGYVLAAVLFALSTAIESGALQAYLYSVVGEAGKNSFGKFWARVSAMVMVSYTLAYILTSIIGANYPLLIILSIAPCLVALLISLSLPVDNMARAENEAKPRIFASAIKHIKSSPDLIKLILSGVVVVALAQVMIEYLSLYYSQVGVATRYVPIVMAFGNVIGAIMFWSLHSWEKVLNRYKLAAVILVAATFVLSFYGGVVITAIGVLVFTRFVRVLQVQYESNIQHMANDETRATVSSIGSFMSSLIGSAIFVLIGLSAVDNKVILPIRIAMLLGMAIYTITLLISRRRTNNFS